MKRIPIPMEEVEAALEEKLPGAVVEQDKDWLWLLQPPVGPVHAVKGGCQCDECKERAAKREILKSLNFIFSFREHSCPSGAKSRWGNSCLKPLPFHRNKSKTKPASPGSVPIVPAMEEDKELKEAMQFFNE